MSLPARPARSKSDEKSEFQTSLFRHRESLLRVFNMLRIVTVCALK